MYIFNGVKQRDHEPRLEGLSDPTSDSLAAIKAALDLNPKDGYVKGSVARTRLEAAFESVPQCSALELAKRLLQGEGPLEKLFRRRLHAATQRTMLLVLASKAKVCLQLQQEDRRRKEEEMRRQQFRRLEELRQQICEATGTADKLAEEVCRRVGQNSAQCRQLRADAIKSREELSTSGIRCPIAAGR